MFLDEILKILYENVAAMGFRTFDCFKCIFSNIYYDNSLDNDEEIAKKIFYAKRALPQEVTRDLCLTNKFDLLCSNIQNNYLKVAGAHKRIFDSIIELLNKCEYMNSCDKERIVANCNPLQVSELARFIACCIVCSNYNTIQRNKREKKQIKEHYSLNLDFMNLQYTAEELKFKKKLWLASQRNYLISHEKGNRFYNLNIIKKLLPQGFLTNTHFVSYGKTEEGKIAPVKELCEGTNNSVAIIGDGGIGKTTFLQDLMGKEFLQANGKPKEYMESRAVFVFVELNRCPRNIENWYNDSLRKTNFITRYIGQLLENHTSIDNVSSDTLDMIEKELQRENIYRKPQYILLLDGFNEISTDNSVRMHISNEISTLSRYENVRIITTSRMTQSAYYTNEFDNIYLVGLKKKEIFKYLRECNISDIVIGEVKECDSLLKCLRFPLYLCMFATKAERDAFLPETAGEILYTFFHRNSVFYNTRKRMLETNSCRLNEKQITFILNFIIPYIGWVFENNDIFYMSYKKFNDVIKEAFDKVKILFCSSVNPFKDFEYNGKIINDILESLCINGKPNIDDVITCIYDYLGIVYQYSVDDGDFDKRVRYSFCHHQFRDYFSSVWDIQILSMLQCVEPNKTIDCKISFYNEVKKFLDVRYWQLHKSHFISEILMEHRNRPYYDDKKSSWLLPIAKYDEQKVLTNAIDYCRKLHALKIETEHILPNILSSILFGRKEYSGLNLSGLNLKNCCFFNINCSRIGPNNALSVDFSNSALTKENFTPENHLNNVMEYVYYDEHCYTIDDAGIIKCWDVFSGKMEYELHSGNPLGISDFSVKGYIKVSPDGTWLAAKVQETKKDGEDVAVFIFDLKNTTKPPMIFKTSERHKIISYFTFTQDSKNIIILYDRKIVYCIDTLTQKIAYTSKFELYKQSELYAEDVNSNIFAYTAEYDTYETDEALMSTWINDEDFMDYDMEEDFETGIPCALCILDVKKNKTQFIYNYTSEPSTAPASVYLPNSKSFIIYNYINKCLEQVFCENKKCKKIMDVINPINVCPSAIHPKCGCENEIFIMYPGICYEANIVGNGQVLMTYSATEIGKRIPDSEQGEEIEFLPYVVPKRNRFIVGDDTNKYEWDSMKDSITLKYNSALYGTTALFATLDKSNFILVHQYNGISIFSGDLLKLEKQYCFYEEGFYIGDACFEPINKILALSFVRPDYEKIILLELDTFKQQTILTAEQEGESFSNMCFSNSGKHLLITSQYRCIEYDMYMGDVITVANSGKNERFISGIYTNEEIEIAVVEHSAVDACRVEPYCIYYKKQGNGSDAVFKKIWYYVMPKLEKEAFTRFIYQNNDLGALGSLDKDGSQQYWVTRGFFLEVLPEVEKILRPKCYAWKGNRIISIEKFLKANEMIFVYHTSQLTNAYGCGDTGFSYTFLSDDMKEAIFLENRQKLLYCKDINNLDYQKLEHKMMINSSCANTNAFWDFAVPMSNDNILGCYEFYNLIEVNASNNALLNEVEYYPGIAIAKCNFDDEIFNEDLNDIIKMAAVHTDDK